MKAYQHFLLALKLLLIFVLSFLAFRKVVVPEPYGEFQSFWKKNQGYWKDQVPVQHQGSLSCQEAACHASVGVLWGSSRHKIVSCETCHGVDSGAENRDVIQCLTCHRPLKARPANFPQVSPDQHYPNQNCLGCHDPHAPIPLMRHPMPVARQERGSCLICHQESMEVLPGLPLEEDNTVLGRMFQPPHVSFDHGGRKFCISCHTQSPSLAELATMVHGQDVSYCPKCHREGGLAGTDFR
jgi:hypothetical protein